MQKQQRYRGESYRRVQQFLDAHPDVFGGINSSEARNKLDAALTKLDSTVDLQLARVRDAKGETEHLRVLEQELRDLHMTPVTSFALGQLAGTPNIAALTPAAAHLRGARLVDAARGMAVAAQEHVPLFAAAVFPPDFTQQLTDAANAVQASIDTRRRKIADRVNASRGVETALGEARSAALMVDAAVGRIVRRGTPLHREWQLVRHVAVAAKRKKEEATPVPPGSEPVPAAPVSADVKKEVTA